MAFDVIRLSDRDSWRNALSQFEQTDVYYTPEYAEIQERMGEGEAHLAVWSSAHSDEIVIYSFLLRGIPEHDGLYDIVTPYGYGGPLCHGQDDAHRNSIEGFHTDFCAYCRDTHIVSEFVRFHPLLGNATSLAHGLSCDYVRDTVVVALMPEVDPICTFPSKTRNMVRKAMKNGVTIDISSSDASLAEFRELYESTMERNCALPYYFFSDQYYRDVMTLLNPQPFIAIARYEGIAIAAAIFLRQGKFLHYHLSGSNRKYNHLAPMNLLIGEAAREGARLGAELLHLGGGYREPEDSLFRFKASFSGGRRRFHVGRRIHNVDRFRLLCRLHGPGRDGFFPPYRS